MEPATARGTTTKAGFRPPEDRARSAPGAVPSASGPSPDGTPAAASEANGRERTPRRAELVAAAARLFSERGYHGTSMQHLGDAVGVLRGSLYAHIGSKEELLFDVADEGANRFLDRGRAAIAGDGSASERLLRLLVAHIETATEHLQAATVFLNEWRYLGEDLRATIRDKRDRYEALVRGVIADGIARGEFARTTDPAMGARLVLSAGNWTYAWYHPGGELTPRDIAHSYWKLIVDGLKEREDG